MNRPRKRPAAVIVASVLLMASGLAEVGLAVLMVAKRQDAAFLAGATVTEGELRSITVVVLVVGVTQFLLGFWLRNGSKLARALIATGALTQIGVGIYVMAQIRGASMVGGVGMIAVSALVLHLLFSTEQAKAYYF